MEHIGLYNLGIAEVTDDVLKNLSKTYESLVFEVHKSHFASQVDMAVYTLDRWMCLGKHPTENKPQSAWVRAGELMVEHQDQTVYNFSSVWYVLKFKEQVHLLVRTDKPYVLSHIQQFYEPINVLESVGVSELNQENFDAFIAETNMNITLSFNNDVNQEQIRAQFQLMVPDFTSRLQRIAVLAFLQKEYPSNEWDDLHKDIIANYANYEKRVNKYIDVVKNLLQRDVTPQMLDFIPQ